jgi:hypothetical protein
MSEVNQLVLIVLLTITSAISVLSIITINQCKNYIKRISFILKDLTILFRINQKKMDMYQEESIDYSCQSCVHRKTYLQVGNVNNSSENDFYSVCELKKTQVLLNHSCIQYKSE